MSKLVLFLILLAAIYYLRQMFQGGSNGAQRAAQKPVVREAEAMNACAHCGVLVPASEGVIADGHFYCSGEHARLGRREGQ